MTGPSCELSGWLTAGRRRIRGRSGSSAVLFVAPLFVALLVESPDRLTTVAPLDAAPEGA